MVETIEQVFSYKENTSAGRFERYLHSKNIPYIGDMNFLLKKYPQRLDNVIPPRWHLTMDERAYRAYHVKGAKMSEEVLTRWQVMEKAHGGFLSVLPAWVRSGSCAMKREQLDDFIGQIKALEPNYEKVWVDPNNSKVSFKIPRRFHYDCEWDELAFTHQWEWAIFHAPIKPPRGNDIISRLED